MGHVRWGDFTLLSHIRLLSHLPSICLSLSTKPLICITTDGKRTLHFVRDRDREHAPLWISEDSSASPWNEAQVIRLDGRSLYLSNLTTVQEFLIYSSWVKLSTVYSQPLCFKYVFSPSRARLTCLNTGSPVGGAV